MPATSPLLVHKRWYAQIRRNPQSPVLDLPELPGISRCHARWSTNAGRTERLRADRGQVGNPSVMASYLAIWVPISPFSTGVAQKLSVHLMGSSRPGDGDVGVAAAQGVRRSSCSTQWSWWRHRRGVKLRFASISVHSRFNSHLATSGQEPQMNANTRE